MLRLHLRVQKPKTPPGYGRLSFRRVLRGECPQCGQGALFASFARLCERCSNCGLVYRREPGGELGSMYLSATVSQVFAAAVFAAVWLGTNWGTVASLAVGIPLVVTFCYAFLPKSMALWTAIEYVIDVGNGEWWAQPRPESGQLLHDSP